MALNTLKEHWEKGAALVALAFEALVAFERHLAEVSLETRFVIAAIAGLTATLSLAEMLRWNPERSSSGFRIHRPLQRCISGRWMIFRILMIVAFSVLSMFLLNKTATFHTICLLQRSDPNDPFVGTIEIQPAHIPTSVRVTLSTSQTDDIRIVDKALGNWNDHDKVEWGMQDDTSFGVTIFLKDFKSPQVFGCWFRLSQSADKLEVEAAPEQAEIQVLREGELHRYRRNIKIFGGVLCILALFVWCYRSCWFRSTV